MHPQAGAEAEPQEHEEEHGEPGGAADGGGEEGVLPGWAGQLCEEVCVAVRYAMRTALHEELAAALPRLLQEHVLAQLSEALVAPAGHDGYGQKRGSSGARPASAANWPGVLRGSWSKDSTTPAGFAKDGCVSLTSSWTAQPRTRLMSARVRPSNARACTESRSSSCVRAWPPEKLQPLYRQSRAPTTKSVPSMHLPGSTCGLHEKAEPGSADQEPCPPRGRQISRALDKYDLNTTCLEGEDSQALKAPPRTTGRPRAETAPEDGRRMQNTPPSMPVSPPPSPVAAASPDTDACDANEAKLGSSMKRFSDNLKRFKQHYNADSAHAPSRTSTPDGKNSSTQPEALLRTTSGASADEGRESRPMSPESSTSLLSLDHDQNHRSGNTSCRASVTSASSYVQFNKQVMAHSMSIRPTMRPSAVATEQTDVASSNRLGSKAANVCSSRHASKQQAPSINDARTESKRTPSISVTPALEDPGSRPDYQRSWSGWSTPNGTSSRKSSPPLCTWSFPFSKPANRRRGTSGRRGNVADSFKGDAFRFSSVMEAFDTQRQASDKSPSLPPWGRENRRNAVILPPASVQSLAQSRTPSRSLDLLGRIRWALVRPDSWPRRCWDIVGFVFLAVQLTYLPFQIAFLSTKELEEGAFAAAEMPLAFIDFFFLLDLMLNFVAGFHNSNRVLETDMRAIAVHYLRGWFLVDLVATIPRIVYCWLVVELQERFWYLNLAFLFRVLRLAKLDGHMRELEAYLKSRHASSAIALGKLLLLPVVISHCTACALWGVGRTNLEWDPTSPSWIKDGLRITEEVNALAAVQVRDRYICAMYFSLTVMSTVGLGDIAAELPNERGLLMIIMISTSIVIGVAVNGVSHFVSKMGERTTEKNERLTKVATFMKWYQVPSDLQSRVHAYLQQFFENKDRDDVKQGLMEWMRKSDMLRAELNLALTGKCLMEHRLLAELPRDLLVEVCDMCEMVFRPPGDVLESPGCEVVRCLYIRKGAVFLSEGTHTVKSRCMASPSLVVSGWMGSQAPFSGQASVDVVEGGQCFPQQLQQDVSVADLTQPAGILGAGSFLSDMGLFFGAIQTQRIATCNAFCELISLECTAFRQWMNERNPQLLHMLSIYALIELDSPSALLQRLQEWEQHADETLLHGEVALHDCAKQNAAKCAALLISADADVESLDMDDHTPVQLAAERKHKEIFEVLVLHGAQVRDEDVLPPAWLDVMMDSPPRKAESSPASAESVGLSRSIFPPLSTQSVFSMDRAEERGLEDFQLYVAAHDLNLDLHGHGGTKGLVDLFEEIKSGGCSLEGGKRGRLRRRVLVVRLRLIAIIDEEVRTLLEVEPAHWLKSPETKLAKLPSKRVTNGLVQDALEELIVGRLGLTLEFYADHMAELSRTISVETKPSMTYPGLDTEYVCIEATMRVRSSGMAEGAAIGLPKGSGFQRSEEMEHLSTRSSVFFWPILTSICADFASTTSSEPERFQLVRASSARFVAKRQSFFSRLSPFGEGPKWTAYAH